MRRLESYWQTAVMAARSSWANPWRIFTGGLLTVVRITLFAGIYREAYRAPDAAEVNYDYKKVVWSLALFFVFNLNLGLRDAFRTTHVDIRTGDIRTQLTRPLEWRLGKAAQVLGRNSVEFAILAVVMPLGLAFSIGVPDLDFLTPGFVLAYLALTLVTIASATTMFMTIGLWSLWMSDPVAVSRMLERLIMVLGGAFVPVVMLPAILQTLMRYSPFGVLAAPTQLFNPTLGSVIGIYLVTAVVWTALVALFNNFWWRRFQRRMEVFGV